MLKMSKAKKMIVGFTLTIVLLTGCDDPKGKCQALSCLPDTSGITNEVKAAYDDTVTGGTIDPNGTQLEQQAAKAIEWAMTNE